ncbi:hypothetical protein CNR29_07530 [Levilactobacillus brevis]|uniref:DUF2513 domain-containing protein n=1 Tax=Levilactobacillus brevis TaxID=1580 RepID=A0A2A3TY88_LEVBR|nr:DUF2513 domain-containing protein [Levilactobacillus brevis]PBQ23875.1 hypothetical protein CNR29_07530 [Levilactobacillus brevis]
MKLDHDCVRDVLLWVETNVPLQEPVATHDLLNEFQDKWDRSETTYCIIQLNEAGMIDGGASVQNGIVSINYIQRLTWKGHEYLDNIRNDTIWKETKNTVISKVGSASLSIVSSVAAKLIEDKFNL